MIAQNSGYAPGRVGRAPRRRHRLDDGSGVTSCTVLCYQISVYLVGLIAVPIMFIFNVGLYISLVRSWLLPPRKPTPSSSGCFPASLCSPYFPTFPALRSSPLRPGESPDGL